MSGDLDSSASFELRPRIDLPLMLGPPLKREVEFSHMTKDFFEWQYTRPRICPLRDFATLRTYSPEIKARQALFAFLPVYPELVGVVGSRVPDYRGIFLRGQGSQTSTHYGTVTHSSAALGQLQGDGIRTIWGTFVGGDWSGHDKGGSSGAFWPAGNAGVQEGDDYNQIRYSFDVSRVTPVVGEVRPVNRAVRYLIRAR